MFTKFIKLIFSLFHNYVLATIPHVVATEQFHANNCEEVVQNKHYDYGGAHQRGEYNDRAKYISITFLDFKQSQQPERSEDNEKCHGGE